MPLLKTRIVPKTDARSFALLGAASAVVWALLILAGVPSHVASLLPQMQFVVPVQVLAFLTIMLAPIALVLRVTQRPKPVLGFAFAYSATLVTIAAFSQALERVDGGAIVLEWLDLDLLLMPFAGLLMVLIALIMLAASRWTIRRIEEHGPEDCPVCGYTYGGETISVCAECGTDRASARTAVPHTLALFTIAKRATPWIIAPSLLIGAAYTAFVVTTRTVPTLRILWAIPHNAAHTAYTHEIANLDASYQASEAVVLWREEAPGSQRGLCIWYKPNRFGKFPMAIWVGSRPQAWGGSDPGSAVIITGLTPSQMNSVISSGVPESLRKALFQKAAEVGWTSGPHRQPPLFPITASDHFPE